MSKPIDAIAFDLGGVLIDWDPRYLYRRLFGGDDAAMEAFLAEVCTPDWNAEQDRGRPWAEAIESLARMHPDKRDLIAAYRDQWEDMLRGAIDETVEIVDELRRRGDVRLFVLSNWSAETYPIAIRRFPFLEWFDGIVISGDVRACKPEPEAFAALIDRFTLTPASTVFVDDTPPNVAAARELGMIAVQFESPAGLRNALEELGVLDGTDGGRKSKEGSADVAPVEGERLRGRNG